VTTQRPGFHVVLMALAACIAVDAAPGQAITEFRTPTSGSQPLEIASGPGGMMWFTENGANRIGSITPGGNFSEFQVSRSPRAIVAGPDRNLWFTSDGYVSRLTPGGIVTDFISDPKPNGPGSVVMGPASSYGWPASITVGPDHRLWFTDVEITNGGLIGTVDTNGQVYEDWIWSLRAEDPAGITLGPDGNLWFTVFGQYGDATINRLRLTPSFDFTEFVLPGVHGVWGIAAGSDGNLWFTETDANKVGRITTSGDITEFIVSGNPRGIAAGPDGNLWFTENSGNKIGRITTGGEVTEFPIPTPNARPWGIAAGPDGNIWFTEKGASQIGRVSLSGGCDANTLCLGGSRFHVTVHWQSQTASGLGQAVSLTPDTGYFWFLDSSNVEMLVKVLDACSASGRKWVFAAGLTNLNVVMTVTDTQTGLSRTYTNPQGTAFLPIQDTDAFSTCP
jgi:streptogramin lyase